MASDVNARPRERLKAIELLRRIALGPRKAQALNINDYISKPFEQGALTPRVRNAVGCGGLVVNGKEGSWRVRQMRDANGIA